VQTNPVIYFVGVVTVVSLRNHGLPSRDGSSAEFLRAPNVPAVIPFGKNVNDLPDSGTAHNGSFPFVKSRPEDDTGVLCHPTAFFDEAAGGL
jgi:hypothetical protein